MKELNHEKPWLVQYDPFVPRSLQYPILNIPQVLDQAVKEYPDKVCLHFQGTDLTYQQVADASDNLARWLVASGIKKGDRVGLMLLNSPQFVISFFAVQKAGAVVVAMNPFYKKPEFSVIISECSVKCIICLNDHIPVLHEIGETYPMEAVIISEKEDFKQKDFPDSISRDQIKSGEIQPIAFPLSFKRCIECEIMDIPLDYSYNPDEPAIYQYSGGTTGVPKAVIGLHRNIVANTIQFMTWCSLQTAEETFLAAIPLYHVYGMVLAMMLGIRLVARIVLIEDARDSDAILRAIVEQQVTFYPGVPTMYAAIIRNQAVLDGKYDLRSIKACISGSATLHPNVKKQFEELTKGKLVEGYGLSEAPTATHCNPLFGKNPPGSFGLPLPDVDCLVVDIEDDTKPVEVGEAGELLIRGPQIMMGYYQNLQETELTLKGGWLHTGDIVKMDGDGYFYFVDRKKDLIKVGGFQVWPKEIEEVLLTLKGVQGAAVAGIKNEIDEEKVVAWVVLEKGVVFSVAEIRDYCRKFLTAYKIPKEVYFVNEIPRTGVGKTLRRELVRLYHENEKRL